MPAQHTAPITIITTASNNSSTLFFNPAYRPDLYGTPSPSPEDVTLSQTLTPALSVKQRASPALPPPRTAPTSRATVSDLTHPLPPPKPTSAAAARKSAASRESSRGSSSSSSSVSSVASSSNSGTVPLEDIEDLNDIDTSDMQMLFEQDDLEAIGLFSTNGPFASNFSLADLLEASPDITDADIQNVPDSPPENMFADGPVSSAFSL